VVPWWYLAAAVLAVMGVSLVVGWLSGRGPSRVDRMLLKDVEARLGRLEGRDHARSAAAAVGRVPVEAPVPDRPPMVVAGSDLPRRGGLDATLVAADWPPPVSYAPDVTVTSGVPALTPEAAAEVGRATAVLLAGVRDGRWPPDLSEAVEPADDEDGAPPDADSPPPGGPPPPVGSYAWQAASVPDGYCVWPDARLMPRVRMLARAARRQRMRAAGWRVAGAVVGAAPRWLLALAVLAGLGLHAGRRRAARWLAGWLAGLRDQFTQQRARRRRGRHEARQAGESWWDIAPQAMPRWAADRRAAAAEVEKLTGMSRAAAWREQLAEMREALRPPARTMVPTWPSMGCCP
jgi:hypothetical protein